MKYILQEEWKKASKDVHLIHNLDIRCRFFLKMKNLSKTVTSGTAHITTPYYKRRVNGYFGTLISGEEEDNDNNDKILGKVLKKPCR